MSTREQILIVDDQENNRLVVEDHLRKLRCDIHGASSGEEALEMLSAIKPDCILMDIMMPGMDGLGAFDETPENSPANSQAALSISDLPSHLLSISTGSLVGATVG